MEQYHGIIAECVSKIQLYGGRTESDRIKLMTEKEEIIHRLYQHPSLFSKTSRASKNPSRYGNEQVVLYYLGWFYAILMSKKRKTRIQAEIIKRGKDSIMHTAWEQVKQNECKHQYQSTNWFSWIVDTCGKFERSRKRKGSPQRAQIAASFLSSAI